MEWLLIDEKTPKSLYDTIIAGFAPDEENFSPKSREYYWEPIKNQWQPTSDPTWKRPPQPTHWMPLPEPPK